jgi:SAM-dependent methyltransferase
MAGNERDLHPLPEEAFGRYDETPDEEFYLLPRFVTHIDDHAIAAVTQLYREFFPAGGEILDLMSSWVSHLPPAVSYRRVIGLGMNEAELRRNERLDSYVVQNLNRTPELPFHDAEFDGCGICVSIDYLTRPVEVLREVGRALKVGAFQVASDRQDVGQLRRLEHRESPEKVGGDPAVPASCRARFGGRYQPCSYCLGDEVPGYVVEQRVCGAVLYRIARLLDVLLQHVGEVDPVEQVAPALNHRLDPRLACCPTLLKRYRNGM